MKRLILTGKYLLSSRLVVATGIVLAVLGITVITRAATPSVVIESEAGTLSAQAIVADSTSASGGKYVNYGASQTPQGCTNPLFTTSGANSGWSNGGYYVHNNMWNSGEAGPQTLFACSYKSWYVTSTQPNSTSVKTYPNTHLDINNLNGRPLSNYTTITSTFASAAMPNYGIYNVAYDLWLNGVGWGGGTTEYMIWTENRNQVPLGNRLSSPVLFGGQIYDAYRYNDGDANVISLVATSTMRSGNINLMEMIQWAIARGWIPANPTVNQIGYGVEICDTDNISTKFEFTDFSVTIN
jgi:hypothetical protein